MNFGKIKEHLENRQIDKFRRELDCIDTPDPIITKEKVEQLPGSNRLYNQDLEQKPSHWREHPAKTAATAGSILVAAAGLVFFGFRRQHDSDVANSPAIHREHMASDAAGCLAVANAGTRYQDLTAPNGQPQLSDYQAYHELLSPQAPNTAIAGAGLCTPESFMARIGEMNADKILPRAEIASGIVQVPAAVKPPGQ
ncbi:MAG: hypothetical protein ACREGA_03450 [Candidatus Saccharimonadales bacterium]